MLSLRQKLSLRKETFLSDSGWAWCCFYKREEARGGQTSLEGLLLNVQCNLYLGGKHAVESWVVSSPKDSFGEKAALKSDIELVREPLEHCVLLGLHLTRQICGQHDSSADQNT